MAQYNQISYGSKGNDVTELQKLLNKNGYALDEDGVFGSNTQAAVKDYQEKNNLTVDGIVGENTWGSLTSVSTDTDTAVQDSTASTPTYTPYTPSDTVTQAQQLLNQQLSQQPGSYQSPWSQQLNDTIQQILNREKFSYDLNADALYQQYKDQYIAGGRMAMMDTMGQASALTGGYGNSYAQSVGQQAYQGYLQQLNDKVPELYQLALNRYQLEGDQMAQDYALLAAQEDQAYNRYQNELAQWQAERDYLAGRYDSEREYDYSQYWNNQNFAYQQERDQIADQQWQAQFDESKRQFDLQYAQSRSSGGGGGGGGGDYTDYDNEYSESDIKRVQAAIGVPTTGVYDDETISKLDTLGYTMEDVLDGMYSRRPSNDNNAEKSYYASFELGDWKRYFEGYVSQYGKSAAREEYYRLKKEGYIPTLGGTIISWINDLFS